MIRFGLLIVGSSLLSGVALASETVLFNGATTGLSLTITRSTGRIQPTFVGTMDATIDGDHEAVYCVDLDHGISNGQSYEADLVEVGNESPWCEINWIITNGDASTATGAAAVQLAVWQATYAASGVTVSSSSATVNAAAAELLADSAGQCPLTCDAGAVSFEASSASAADGYVYTTLTVTQDGLPASGQWVSVSVTDGALVTDSEAMTDADGQVTIQIDPDGTTSSVAFSLDGASLYQLVPVGNVQLLIATTLETCSYETSESFEDVAFGDPRTIGFWGHNVGIANGTARGHAQVGAATIAGWLPITVFDTTYSTIGQMDAALQLSRASMRQRADQQCLATMLNLEYGQYGWLTEIDTDGDGVADTAFWQLWSDISAAYAAGSYEAAKTGCDTINNL